MTMFWGMTLEPGKLYTETMGEEVQLSMAAIDSRKDPGEDPGTNFCQIVIQTEKGEYVLCTLVHGVMFQQSLDLKLMPREKVTFSVQGPNVVSLVGYTASYPEDEEELAMQQEEYEEDSSAWDTFEEGEAATQDIKQEPVEILDDSDTDVETDDKTQIQGQIAAAGTPGSTHAQEPVVSQEQIEGAAADVSNKEEEMIFSVAEIDQSVVKTEAPDPDSESGGVMPPSQQLPPQGEMYGTQPADQGLGPTSTSQDFFYPETQPQSNVPLTAPVTFQPINSAGDFQPQNPLPGGVLPPEETFLQQTTPKTLMQRSQAGPIRQSSTRQPAPRTYPSPRRQYGTNRSQPAGKTRSAPQSMNMQQIRNTGNLPQQSMPGPGPQDVAGPSTSGSPRFASSVQHMLPAPGGEVRPPGSAKPRGGRHGPRPFTKSLAMPPGGEFCRKCGKYIEDLARLRAHEKYHELLGRYQCRFCGKPFASKQDLDRHERSHTGEKAFICSICSRGFNRSDRLRAHVKKEHPTGS